MSTENEGGMDDWAEAMAEQEGQEKSVDMGANEMEVQVAELDELQDAQPLSDDQHRKLDTILDIPVTISMRCTMSY